MKGPAALDCGQSCAPVLAQGADAFDLYTEGDALYGAMLASISAACSMVLLESYIFADDEIGRESARTRGVRENRHRKGMK